MKALILSCTLKSSPQSSNSEALAQIMIRELAGQGIESEMLRLARVLAGWRAARFCSVHARSMASPSHSSPKQVDFWQPSTALHRATCC